VLAQYSLDAGQVGEAVPLLVEADRVQRSQHESHPDRYWKAVLICRFARALALKGLASPAARLLSCFETLREETGVHLERWVARMNDATLVLIRCQLDEAAIAEAGRQGQALTYDEAVALAIGELNAHA
jgi:hypothetical protein